MMMLSLLPLLCQACCGACHRCQSSSRALGLPLLRFDPNGEGKSFASEMEEFGV